MTEWITSPAGTALACVLVIVLAVYAIRGVGWREEDNTPKRVQPEEIRQMKMHAISSRGGKREMPWTAEELAEMARVDAEIEAERKNAEYQRRYYQTHKDEAAERQRRYRQTHKDEVAEYQRRYRQMKKKSAGCAGTQTTRSTNRHSTNNIAGGGENVKPL